jgi:hypothetical protein
MSQTGGCSDTDCCGPGSEPALKVQAHTQEVPAAPETAVAAEARPSLVLDENPGGEGCSGRDCCGPG